MRRALGIAAVVLIAAAVVGSVMVFVGREPAREDASTAPAFVPSELTLLVVRTDAGPLLAVVGANGMPAPAAMAIPSALALTIPGQGEGTVRDAAVLPGPQAQTAISNLIGMWIDHYAITDIAHLAAVVDRVGGVDLYGKTASGEDVAAELSTQTPSRPLTWRQVLGGLLAAAPSWTAVDFAQSDDPGAVISVLAAASGAKVRTLPSSKVVSGMLRPNDEALASLVSQAFGGPGTPPVGVIVLNGSGAPGVGQSVAERLIPGGFRVVVSENASSFDHETTLVVAGTKDDQAAAERAQKLLGVGTVSVAGVPSGLGDVTIVVGKDYVSG